MHLFRQIRNLIDRLGLQDEFRDMDNVYTYFLPDDSAFRELRGGQIDRNIMRGHIVRNEPFFLRTMNESRLGSNFFAGREPDMRSVHFGGGGGGDFLSMPDVVQYFTKFGYSEIELIFLIWPIL